MVVKHKPVFRRPGLSSRRCVSCSGEPRLVGMWVLVVDLAVVLIMVVVVADTTSSSSTSATSSISRTRYDILDCLFFFFNLYRYTEPFYLAISIDNRLLITVFFLGNNYCLTCVIYLFHLKTVYLNVTLKSHIIHNNG